MLHSRGRMDHLERRIAHLLLSTKLLPPHMQEETTTKPTRSQKDSTDEIHSQTSTSSFPITISLPGSLSLRGKERKKGPTISVAGFFLLPNLKGPASRPKNGPATRASSNSSFFRTYDVLLPDLEPARKSSSPRCHRKIPLPLSLALSDALSQIDTRETDLRKR
jgi:hypothetical protein